MTASPAQLVVEDLLRLCAERADAGRWEYLYDWNLPALFRAIANYYAASDDPMDKIIKREAEAAVAARSA